MCSARILRRVGLRTLRSAVTGSQSSHCGGAAVMTINSTQLGRGSDSTSTQSTRQFTLGAQLAGTNNHPDEVRVIRAFSWRLLTDLLDRSYEMNTGRLSFRS